MSDDKHYRITLEGAWVPQEGMVTNRAIRYCICCHRIISNCGGAGRYIHDSCLHKLESGDIAKVIPDSFWED